MLAVLLFGGIVLPSDAVQAKKAPPTGISTPISGVIDALDGGGTFVGTLKITQFASQAGSLVAKGTLTGNLTNAAGTTAVTQAVTIPVVDLNGTCEILDLVLGPLDLNLLGLVVHLDQVVLTITAQQGALLGDLLCSIANLLNNNSPLSALATLLNNLLKALG